MSAEFVLVNAPLTALFITRGLGSAGCHAELAIGYYRSVTRYINFKFAADQPDLSNGPEAQNMP